MGRSWIDNETTKRYYRLDSDRYCIVKNEYQRVRCPHCDETQYGRLTHFCLVSEIPGESQVFSHNNYNSDLDELKKVVVQYFGTDSAQEAVTERFVDGNWVLLKDGQLFGNEFDPGEQL